jgi:hypothetical protein
MHNQCEENEWKLLVDRQTAAKLLQRGHKKAYRISPESVSMALL